MLVLRWIKKYEAVMGWMTLTWQPDILREKTHPNAQVHKFSRNLETTSKFCMPEGWHEASSILSIHRYLAPLYKIYSCGRLYAQDPGSLCPPHVPHRLAWQQIEISTVTNCLSNDRAHRCILPFHVISFEIMGIIKLTTKN